MKFKYQESKEEELFSAVKSNNLKKVKNLLSSGDIDISSIDPDVEGTQGRLLIASAVCTSTEMVKLLIESGVTKSINTVLVDGNLNGKTILGYAVRDRNEDLAKLLVKTGAKLNNGEFLGSYWIQNHPIRYGSCELLIELLKLTSKKDMLDALRTATMFKRNDIVKAIISSGLCEFKDIVQYYKGTETLIHLTNILPDITPTEMQKDIGSALLKYAIIDKNMDLIKQLIKTGAKFGNQFGDIISDLTKHGNYELLIELLKLTSKEDVLGGLKTAVECKRNDVIKAVVSSGLCEFKDIIEYYNKDAITLIHLTRILNFSVFDILPNITPTEMQGNIGGILLADAIIDKNKSLVESLIKAGAKFSNIRYFVGNPFKDENCELLIELLKLTSKEDMLGGLKIAVECKRDDVIKAVISSGLCEFKDIMVYYNKDTVTLANLTKVLDSLVFDKIVPDITHKFDDLEDLEKSLIGKESNNELDEI